MILNLKKLNKHIASIHFKMDTLQSCIKLMKQNCYFGSIEFKVGHQLYKFITLPNGLSSAPRIFTKLMKPEYSTLRTTGHISSGYLDDSFLFGTPDQCKADINDIFTLFGYLGFNVSREESITHQTQAIEHLGFVLNSINMTVTLPKEKIDTIIQLESDILESQSCSIREDAKLIGTLLSCSPGVKYGHCSTNSLNMTKIAALKKHRGSFEAQMQFSELAKSDIRRWTTKSWQNIKAISHGNPYFSITADASLEGWGACKNGMELTGSRWLAEETAECENINCLELKAAKFGLLSLCEKEEHVHIHCLTSTF